MQQNGWVGGTAKETHLISYDLRLRSVYLSHHSEWEKKWQVSRKKAERLPSRSCWEWSPVPRLGPTAQPRNSFIFSLCFFSQKRWKNCTVKTSVHHLDFTVVKFCPMISEMAELRIILGRWGRGGAWCFRMMFVFQAIPLSQSLKHGLTTTKKVFMWTFSWRYKIKLLSDIHNFIEKAYAPPKPF